MRPDRLAAFALIALFVGLGGQKELHTYFVDQPKHPGVWAEFSAGEYLMGKWLGITLLNLLLLTVACTGIYAFTKLLEAQPARDAEDRLELRRREPGELQTMFNEILERLREDQPERYGSPGSPTDDLAPADRADIQQKVMLQWFSIPNQSFISARLPELCA